MNTKGITDVVVLNDIKAVDYYRTAPFIIFPRNVRIENVMNGYYYTYELQLIVVGKTRTLFAENLELVDKLIGVELDSDPEEVILKVTGRKFDTSLKGLFREIFDFEVSVFIPL